MTHSTLEYERGVTDGCRQCRQGKQMPGDIRKLARNTSNPYANGYSWGYRAQEINAERWAKLNRRTA